MSPEDSRSQILILLVDMNSTDPRNMWLVTGRLLTAWWEHVVSGAEIVVAPCLSPHLLLCLQGVP